MLATEPTITSDTQEVVTTILVRHIKFDRVSFTYPVSTDLVLKGISLEAHRGETIAIIGSTGVGKSTLVQLIPRLYDMSSGSIRIDGMDIRELPLEELRSRIGIIFQDSFLF